ncbi:MAG: PAS domain S-box protein, partial [Gammaproteobacteria bacterium]|nr:PAS domain S-box protein [Gammaproteobacteria bacterium]
IGRKIEMLLPERFQHRHLEQLKDYYANPGTRQMVDGLDFVACRKYGIEFPCKITLNQLETADGSFVICCLHDISKRKHAEAALLESHALLNAVIEGTPDAIFAKDIDGRHTLANTALAQIVDQSVENIIGKTNSELFPPDMARVFNEEDNHIISSGEKFSMEQEFLTKESMRTILVDKYPYLNAEGKTLGVIGIVHDITERKMIEKSLREAHVQLEKNVQKRTKELRDANIKLQREHDALVISEHRLRQLVESTNAIPWEADAKTWQFTYVGPQAVRLMGYPVKQWYEKDFWADHIHPDDRDYAINYCLDLSQRFGDYEFDYRMMTANGEVVWLHDIVKVDRKNGEIDALRGYMINVTERKKMEEEMHEAIDEASMQRERLAHIIRVQTLGEMASGIAHEINQPLAAIESYAQASQQHLQSGTAKAEKIDELLDKISGQAKRAGAVVSRLRAMMRRRTVNTSPVNINELLIEVSKIAEIDTRLHECDLQLKLGPSLPNVIVDDIQIQQVVLNLIRNGIDAMINTDCCHDKTITINTKRNNENDVLISITDCGPGIAEADAADIFEAFYTTKDSGLGMGLAICRNIINAHGGEIDFSQGEAGGTTFHFTLPFETQTV